MHLNYGNNIHRKRYPNVPLAAEHFIENLDFVTLEEIGTKEFLDMHEEFHVRLILGALAGDILAFESDSIKEFTTALKWHTTSGQCAENLQIAPLPRPA